MFFGCRCWSCVCWCCFAYVFALCFGGSLPKMSGKILLMSGFFAVWFLCFLRSGFGFGRSSLLFLLLPPFCSWGRLGSLFSSSVCVPAGLPSSKAGSPRHLHMACRSLSSLLSLCPGRPPSSSSSLFSLSLSLLSLSLFSCKHTSDAVRAFACVCVRWRGVRVAFAGRVGVCVCVRVCVCVLMAH